MVEAFKSKAPIASNTTTIPQIFKKWCDMSISEAQILQSAGAAKGHHLKLNKILEPRLRETLSIIHSAITY